MPVGPAAFEIDDQKSVDENLTAFVAELQAIDASLTAVLAPKLGEWSRGKTPDNAALLNELFVATAPKGEGQ